jgi:hypothetical protein
MGASIIEHFSTLHVPRIERHEKCPLEEIITQGGDYGLAVKGNQGHLDESVTSALWI